MHPIQGIPWGDAGIPPLAHTLQYCCERGHDPLGDCGGSRGDSPRLPVIN